MMYYLVMLCMFSCVTAKVLEVQTMQDQDPHNLNVNIINAEVIEYAMDMLGEIGKSLDSQDTSGKMGDGSKFYCLGDVMETYADCRKGCQLLNSTFQSIQCATVDLVSFLTSCITGSMLCYASDINECLENNGGCGEECMNTEGSYECSCPEGYSLDSNMMDCIDINECLENNGGCGEECMNTKGSYECSCPKGYSLDSNMMDCIAIPAALVIVDECEGYNGGCESSPGYWLSVDRCSCISTTCETNQLACPSGECINELWMCNGNEECSDGLDEDEQICLNNVCKDDEFRCASGNCLLQSWLCDGYSDCPDNSDEENCSKSNLNINNNEKRSKYRKLQ